MPDDRVLASDIKSYYSRLNNIRTKFGLTKVTVPTFTSNTTVVLSSQIKSYDSSMADTANSRSEYISKNLPTGNLNVGQPTLKTTDTNIKQMLTNWENACYNRSDDADYGSDEDNTDVWDEADYTIDYDGDNVLVGRSVNGEYTRVCNNVYGYNYDS